MKMTPILSVIAAAVIGLNFGAPAFADTTSKEENTPRQGGLQANDEAIGRGL